MVVAALLTACAFTASASAQDAVIIEKITPTPNGKVVVFDAKGARQGEVSLDAFPPVPFPASGYNPTTRFAKVQVEGREVWVTPLQAQLSIKAQVLKECEMAKRVAGTPYTSRGANDCR